MTPIDRRSFVETVAAMLTGVVLGPTIERVRLIEPAVVPAVLTKSEEITLGRVALFVGARAPGKTVSFWLEHVPFPLTDGEYSFSVDDGYTKRRDAAEGP